MNTKIFEQPSLEKIDLLVSDVITESFCPADVNFGADLGDSDVDYGDPEY